MSTQSLVVTKDVHNNKVIFCGCQQVYGYILSFNTRYIVFTLFLMKYWVSMVCKSSYSFSSYILQCANFFVETEL